MNYDDLNVGDEATVWLNNYKKYYKGTVVKKSNTTIQVEIILRGTPLKYIFNSSTGYERGSNTYYMCCNKLSFISDEEYEKHNKAVDEENNRNYIIKTLVSRLNWSYVSTDDLNKIFEIVKPYYEEQKKCKTNC
jgi:hypothetical protein